MRVNKLSVSAVVCSRLWVSVGRLRRTWLGPAELQSTHRGPTVRETPDGVSCSVLFLEIIGAVE